ncbi:MAG: hypothetical protein Q9220_005965 [cf. Caloplaca sp. 1 TL-2023]
MSPPHADDDNLPPSTALPHHPRLSSSPPSPASDSDSDNDNDDDLPPSYAHLTPTTLSSQDPQTPLLPRRGLKDFESHGTLSQSRVLSKSLAEMHSALSVGRAHSAKGLMVGYFDLPQSHSESQKEQEQEQQRGEGVKWIGIGERRVVIEKPMGQLPRTVGVADRKGQLWLLGEEVMWGVERGGVEVRYRYQVPSGSTRGRGGAEELGTSKEGDMVVEEEREERNREDGEGDDGGAGWDGIPMSLQACYAHFIGRDGLTLERYTVYAGLKRSGYIVTRAPGWYGDASISSSLDTVEAPPQNQEKQQVDGKGDGIWQWLYNLLFTSDGEKRKAERRRREPLGPLVKPGLYRSYSTSHLPQFSRYAFVQCLYMYVWVLGDIYRLLSLIPSHDPTTPTTTTASPSLSPSTDDPPLTIHFHLHKPRPNYRKTAPPPPDYHIHVISARDTPSFPTLSQLDSLMSSVPFAPPPDTEKRKMQRLKHGWRNVLLAVVDQGVVSYLRVADAGFGVERMYERSSGGAGGQGKRGGRGGGGGRGRGGRGKGGRGRGRGG